MKPKVMILCAIGTNRDRDTAWACELAGGIPEIVYINQVIAKTHHLSNYQMLILPGGFSYGDNMGAGELWHRALRQHLLDDLMGFVASGKPILGICNGFQVLVRAGLLSGTLKRNDSDKFECRWVYLRPEAESASVFTQGLAEPIYCPVAHGEGRYGIQTEESGLIAFRYVGPLDELDGYPWNPNGSQDNIAGICNPEGNILGLMPHPENHLIPMHHPQFHRGQQGLMGLPIFKNGIQYARGM